MHVSSGLGGDEQGGGKNPASAIRVLELKLISSFPYSQTTERFTTHLLLRTAVSVNASCLPTRGLIICEKRRNAEAVYRILSRLERTHSSSRHDPRRHVPRSRWTRRHRATDAGASANPAEQSIPRATRARELIARRPEYSTTMYVLCTKPSTGPDSSSAQVRRKSRAENRPLSCKIPLS